MADPVDEELSESRAYDLLAGLLQRICDVVKGKPPPLRLFSWHDLPELVETQMQRSRARHEALRKFAVKFAPARAGLKHCVLCQAGPWRGVRELHRADCLAAPDGPYDIAADNGPEAA